ncbi:MAG: BatA domain-containing protein, partial [Planctomycetaceae bacterium]|nr:BatA domain-containing protein [Planctomycetaceae bacterium]
MSFLNLAFLWGLPLLGVPVAIHLLSRRRQAVVKWGAMQFLMDSSI